MSDLQIIQTALSETADRCRWVAGNRQLWRGMRAGAVLALIPLLAWKIFPFDFRIVVAFSMAPIAGAVGGFLLGWFRKPTLQSVARWVDARLDTRETLGTALEWASKPQSDPWQNLVLADAVVTVKAIDRHQLLPLQLTREARWSLGLLVLIFCLAWVPEHRSALDEGLAREERNIREAGTQLREIARRSLEQRQPISPGTREALEGMQELGLELERKTLTRDEALKDLAQNRDRLKNQVEELAKTPMDQNLQRAAREGGQAGLNPENLRSRMEALKKSLGTAATPEQLAKLEKQLEKIRDAAQAAQNTKGAAAATARQEMAGALGALEQEARDLGLSLPQLDAAMAALAANDPSRMLQEMQKALTDLDKLRETAKAIEQMQGQMEQLGKNLAEQLGKGQMEAAQSTLRKMVRELKGQRLNPEQVREMLQELEKALEPASKYGDVPEDLKKALARIKAGQNSGAGESLQAAADKLAKMSEQLGDAQQMLAALDSLNQASAAIGSGQGWRVAKGGKPSTDPTRQPGGGVGTWAADGLTEEAEQTEPWDNMDLSRPGMKARGLSDRGEGSRPEGMKPDRVKGTFSPGAPMPGITLKGVSIRGQSRVALQEAAVAAQSEAQSAVTQDKVPQAYQGTVRQYFDDIKK